MTLYVNGIQRVKLLKIHKTVAFLYLRDVFLVVVVVFVIVFAAGFLIRFFCKTFLIWQ